MKIYLIPGQGYNHRIFENLKLDSLDIDYLNWIEPEIDESFLYYAKRFAEMIDDNNEKIILIGHSLGGLIAQEIATFKEIDKIILISSLKSREEMPFLLKLVKPLKIYKLLTKEFSKRTVKFWGRFHSFNSKEKYNLFKEMIDDYSNVYLQWSFRELSSWKPKVISDSTTIIHIHGTKDKTFSIKKIQKPVVIIEGGSHIMVYEKGNLMSEVLLKIIHN